MQILITGATSGIGAALAGALASDGHVLHLHGRDSVKLESLIAAINGHDSDSAVYRADFGQTHEIDSLAAQIAENTSKLDVVINNAFGKLEKPLAECTADEIASFFAVSVTGTVQVVRAHLNLLRASTSPRIVNIVADWGFPMHNIMTGPSPYISAKYAVHGFGAALQTELGAYGVRTTNICPGVTAADVGWDVSDEDFARSHGLNAIHPRVIVEAVRFVIAASSAHVRSIVLSPACGDYNGI